MHHPKRGVINPKPASIKGRLATFKTGVVIQGLGFRVQGSNLPDGDDVVRQLPEEHLVEGFGLRG